jgi:hypothetical protein
MIEFVTAVEIGVPELFPEHNSTVIRLACDIYYPADFIAVLQAAFAVRQWQSIGEISHVVPPGSPVAATKHRNARKAERVGAVVQAISAEVCHDLLSTTKAAKGYQFSFGRETLKEQLRLFPNSFSCVGVVMPDGTLVAALIEAQVGAGALLVAWDQSAAGRQVSATDLLLLRRLQHCQHAGGAFVDLGTVSRGGVLDWGLVRHKSAFGGYGARRNTFMKTWP